jgi:hypothetical protein
MHILKTSLNFIVPIKRVSQNKSLMTIEKRYEPSPYQHTFNTLERPRDKTPLLARKRLDAMFRRDLTPQIERPKKSIDLPPLHFSPPQLKEYE